MLLIPGDRQRKLMVRSPLSRRKLERKPVRSKSRPMRSLLLRRYVSLRLHELKVVILDVIVRKDVDVLMNVADSHRPRSSGRKVSPSTLNMRRRGSKQRSDGRCTSPHAFHVVARRDSEGWG